MAQHNDLGRKGEDIAAAMLEKKGYVILERNWRSGHKDLDLIATTGNELVVVEVKTRRNDTFGKPEDAVNDLKIRRIVGAADAYVRKKGLDTHVRFDIVTVVLTEEGVEVKHLEDAFFPPIWN